MKKFMLMLALLGSASIAMAVSTQPRANDGTNWETIFIGQSQKVAFTGTSAQSANFTLTSSVVRLTATNDCWVTISTSPTAVADGTQLFVPKGLVILVGVPQSFALGVQTAVKLAVIQDSAAGNLYITEGK